MVKLNNNIINQNIWNDYLPNQEKKNPLFKDIAFNINKVRVWTALALTMLSSTQYAYAKNDTKISSWGGSWTISKTIDNNKLTPEYQKEIDEIIKELNNINIFSEEEKQSIIKTSEENRVLIKEWRLPADFILEVKTTQWINNKTDLNYIVNSWEKLETKTFKEITWLDYLKSPKEWTTVINALFDTSDIDSWLRYGKEARPLTDKEKQDYIADMERVKNAWLTKIPSWQYEWKIIDWKNWLKEWTTFNNFIKDALATFKQAVDNTDFPSKEILRRQFVNSFTISYAKMIPEWERYAILENLWSNIAEYVLLTTPDTKAATIMYGKLKYIFLNDADLKNIKWLEFFADYKVFDKTLNKMSENYNLDKNLSVNTKDAESAKKDAESAKKDAESAKIELWYTNKRLEIGKKRNELWKEILNNVSKYNSTWSKDALFNAQIWIWQMRWLIKEAQELLNLTKKPELKQDITNWITAMNSYIAKLDKKFLPN